VTARKGHQPEEIVAKLRQVDVLVWQGQSVAEAVRSTGVTEVTCYRWRQEFGGLKAGQVRRLKEFETADARLRRAVADLTLDQLTLGEAASGNCRAPRVAAPAASRTFATSCRPPGAAPPGQHRSTRRKLPRGRDDEEQLTADLIGLARRYNRCGYRARSPSCPLRSTAAGWAVDGKRVERIWRRDGLKVPARQQPKRGRLWLADGSCVRLRAARASGPRLVLRLRRGSHP
jgi:putative transposase